MAEVLLENVSRAYPGGTLAVNAVNLCIHDHELLVLVGPSGCGKTTTLRMIAGLEELTSGSISIGGRRVNDVPPRDRDVAMVFQNYALYPHMTVRKNMAFGLELRYGGSLPARILRRLFRPSRAKQMGAERRQIEPRVRAAAGSLGIEHLLDRMPRQLSGGERQRVALGRAIVREPAAFLFDEPLSNLDAKLRVETRKELKQLHQRLEATMIYVTHDQVEALTLGQRIAVMHNGTIQQVGTAMEVYDRPENRFVAGFIGTPAMNFVEGELSETDGNWQFCSDGVAVSIAPPRTGAPPLEAGRPVTLGVRPEDVKPGGDGLPATVSLVEPLGGSSLVYFELAPGAGGEGCQTMVGKCNARTDVRGGEQTRIAFDAARLHLFDAGSGRRLDW